MLDKKEHKRRIAGSVPEKAAGRKKPRNSDISEG